MFAAHVKISHDLDSADLNSTSEVIVQFAHPPTEEHHNKIRNRGGQLRHELGLVKAGVYTLPTNTLQDLANDPEVVYISPNRTLHGSLDNTTAAVNAAAAWQSNLTG